MSSIKFIPIQQGKHFLSVSFCSYQPLTLHPSLTPWRIVTQSLGTRAGWFESQLSEPKMSVLFCFVSYWEQGYWREDLELNGAYKPKPRQQNIAPLLTKRMQANSLFAIKIFIFFDKIMSWKKPVEIGLYLKKKEF